MRKLIRKTSNLKSIENNGYPFLWIFWHPFQGLWNWELVKLIKKIVPFNFVSHRFVSLLIKIDTLLLSLKSRFSKKKCRVDYQESININYFDLGTHKKAEELIFILDNLLLDLPNPYKVFAFEANPHSFAAAQEKCSKFKNVELINSAIVNEIPDLGKLRLYTDASGLGDSLFRPNNPSYMDVPAISLSSFIKGNNVDLQGSINIIRMNIEGSEYDVIADLIENNLIQYFDGYYGMWDDLSKIDINKDKKFRAMLKKHNITPLTFNGRDMKYSKRKIIILEDIKRILSPNH